MMMINADAVLLIHIRVILFIYSTSSTLTPAFLMRALSYFLVHSFSCVLAADSCISL